MIRVIRTINKTRKSDHSGTAMLWRCILDRKLDNIQNGILVNSINSNNSSGYSDTGFLAV